MYMNKKGLGKLERAVTFIEGILSHDKEELRSYPKSNWNQGWILNNRVTL